MNFYKRTFILLFSCIAFPFLVNAQTISGISPNNSNMGATLNVTISGINVNFSAATGATIYKQGITIPANSVTILNSTTLIANFSLPVGPTVFGNYNVNLYGLAPILSNGFTINPTGGGQSYGFLKGNIFKDNNTNCTFDTGTDDPIKANVISINPGGFTTSSDLQGNYKLWIPTGNYTIDAPIIPGSQNTCTGGSVTTSLTVGGDTVNAPAIPMDAIPYFDMGVGMGTNTPRPGFSFSVAVSVYNPGNSLTSGVTLKVLLDTVAVFIADSTPAYINNDTLFYNIAPVSVGHLHTFGFHTTIPTIPTVSLGQYVHTQAWIVPLGTDQNNQNNFTQRSRMISGSYDPNDIQLIFPENKDTIDQIGINDTLLTYHIRFQNTGTDTAFNIVARDTLDTLLNAASIQLLGSSHPYTFSISGKGAMEFYFQNVLLPDSIVNEPKSHGFFEYSIKRVAGLGHGDVIKNTASIYFDFNPAVVTNTTEHTICNSTTASINPSGPVSACAGTPTTLTSGNNASSYLWSTGDTTTSINVSTPGTYSLQTIDNVGCKADSAHVTVTVNPLTAAAFSAQQNFLVLAFTDNSTGSPVAWLWDFGDGNTSTQQNPSHTYAIAGNYTVCLTTSNSCGLDSTCQTVSPASCTMPQAAFSSGSNQNTVSFTDQSTNTLSWSWDFGDGNTSTQQNPAHTYANMGTYTVCLTTTNNCGSNQVCNSIVITCSGPMASFSNSASLNVVSFTDNSTGNPIAWSWSFGDGNTSTLQNPSHAYTSAGSYVVCLIADDGCASNTTCQTITVTCTAPSSGFTFAGNGLTISFSDASSGATTWLWNFDDGNISNSQNPSHSYANYGTYSVCQTVSNGCISSTSCKTVVVTCISPQAIFNFSVAGQTVSFTNSSSGVNSYLWDFGDGSIATNQNPSHTYAGPGSYNVCLIGQAADCGNDTLCQTVLTVGMDEDFKETVQVYPNPAQGIITLDYSLQTSYAINLKLYASTGQLMLSRNLGFKAAGNLTLPLNGLANGIYFLQLQAGEARWTEKIMIEN